ncbi:MAG: efflux RND transporter periplasmic adaptor subunit [Burkholderiales bacterium]|jgi:membrane fusion protein (multidrug efflux system)
MAAKHNAKVWIIAVTALIALMVFTYGLNQGWFKSRTNAPAPVSAPAANSPQKSGNSPAGPGAGGPVLVEVSSVQRTTLADDVTAVGNVLANESVMLRPEISGRIAQIHFREGQIVKQGQLLVSLDSSIPQAELRQAQAELELSRSNFRRSEELARQNFISERAKDEANSNLKVIEARAALAQTRLEKSSIRAPFSGTVGLRRVAVGDFVREGADLVTLEDSTTVKIDFRLPERYVAQIKAGQRFTVETDALPGKSFNAQVELIDPQVEANARTVLVRGKLTNTGGDLRPGMFARVRLILAEKQNVLMIPEEGIVAFADEGKPANFVYKVVDNKAVRTRVETGQRRNAQVEILNGLNEGDQIVTAGQLKLRGREAEIRVAKKGAR